MENISSIHPDGLFFLNGVISLLIGFICMGLHRHSVLNQPWRRLAAAMFAAGSASFMEILAWGLGSYSVVGIVQAFFTTLFCLALFVFGCSCIQERKRFFFFWLAILSIGAALLQGHLLGVNAYRAAILYALGLPAGGMTAYLLLHLYSGISPSHRKLTTLASFSLMAYMVLTAIGTADKVYDPISFLLNNARFEVHTGYSAIFFSCIVLPVFGLCCWGLYPTPPTLPFRQRKIQAFLQLKPMTGIIMIAVCAAGWFFTGVVDKISARDLHLRISERAHLAAATLMPEQIEALTAAGPGAKMLPRQLLRQHFVQLAASQKNILGLSLLAKTDKNEWRYLTDVQSEKGTPAGKNRVGKTLEGADGDALDSVSDVWMEPDWSPVLLFHENKITTLIPIPNAKNGDVRALFSMETDAAEWYKQQLLHRLPVFLGTMLVVLLLVAMLSMQYRTAEAGAALYKSESMFSDMINFLPDATFVLDHEQKMIVWNQALEKMTGVRAETMIGKGDYEYAVPFYGERRPLLVDLIFSDTPFLMEHYKNVKRTGDCIMAETFIPHLKPGGAYLSVIAKARLDARGRVVGGIESVRDITELQRANEALRFEEARLEAQLRLYQMEESSIHDIVHYALEAALRLTQSDVGYVAFTAENETILDMYAWSQSVRERCRVEPVEMRYEVSQTGLWGEPVRKRKAIITNRYDAHAPFCKGMPEGHIALSRHLGAPVMDGEKIVLVVGVGNKETEYDERDVNQLILLMTGMWHILQRKRSELERQHLEEELRQAQKMEAVGRLAGGVAHDFNNLLLPILGLAEMMLAESPPEHPNSVMLRQIVQAAAKAKTLVAQLLAFGRRQVLDIKAVHLEEAIRGFEPLLRCALREDIHLSLHLDSSSCYVQADVNKLEQILMNLVINAQDAMPHGGALRIRTQTLGYDPEEEEERSNTSWAVITVEDTGIGMDDITLSRIFEPFFTTKESGKGTGLGLATVYGIVQQHGGRIAVNSQPGEGTSFTLLLPLADGQMNPDYSCAAMPDWGGSERILLVEDNEIVRTTAGQILRRLGYAVTMTGAPHECIQIFETAPDAYDLLLTDVIMPEMNGIELYHHLSRRKPDLKVLFMSGNEEGIAGLRKTYHGSAPFVAKPFTVTMLGEKVREALHPPERKQ